MKTPEEIYKEILNDKISLEKGIQLLLYSYQESEKENTLIDFKSTLNNISIRFEETFNIVSSILRNNKNPKTTLSIAKIVLINFPEKCEILLRDQIRKESSVIFLTQFLRFLTTQTTETSKNLRNYIIKKYKTIYNINLKECEFLIDLEATQINVAKGLDIKAGYFKKFETDNIDIFKKNSHFNYFVRGYHIRALDLSRWEFNEIPESIRFLSELEYLNLSNLRLKSLPDSIEDLSNLKYLSLNGNSIVKSPNWLFEFSSKKNSKKYLKEGVISSDINALALLEVFLGEKLDKVEQNIDVIQWDTALNYKINDLGNIIGIYIKSESSKIGIFPEQICDLKFLEELELPGSSIKFLPKCIGNLRSLRYLNLYSNRLKSVPITIINLRNLEYLDLDDNDISENSLLNLRWYKIGQNYLENGEFKNAIIECEETLKFYPKNKYAWYHLGVAYIEQERYDEAESAFQAFLKIDESNSLVWSNLSDVYHEKGEYDKAIEAIQHAIDIEPNEAVLFSNLAFNFKKLGKYDDAIEAYLQSIEIDPNNIYVWRDLALIYRDKGEIMKAIDANEHALKLELNSNLNKK
ncbi:MAG: tetratricopeptide repeat protein [Candidatus Hodarchaeota archaeon]